jgi:membrane associated rhomboid family serine protease
MRIDGPFLEQLINDEIILKSDPRYLEWKSLREQYEIYMNQVTSYRFSLINIQPTLLTMFTSMFLHGSIAHLVGNMVFLFLFGFVVEMTMGRKLYLISYIASGFFANLLWLVMEPHNANWALGASGAIFGLAGMYTVLFGMRKIRFFYTVLFYFDYIKAPAIILLPTWLCFQLIEEIFSEDNINNLAHIGGLISGALIAWLSKKYITTINLDYLDEENNKAAFNKQYEEGLKAISEMDNRKAKRIFSELAQQQPDNINITLQLFHLEKLNPELDEIHIYANKIFNLKESDIATIKMQHETFMDYVTRVQPNVRLKPELMLTLALRFARNDYMEEAEKLILHLSTRATDFRGNAEGLVALVTHFRRVNNMLKANKYNSMLQEIYPDSDEALHARHIIKQPL